MSELTNRSSSLRGWLISTFSRWSNQWLARRLPRASFVQLNQRRIFILPTREGLAFLLMVFGIFIGGINYANSLILAVAFLLVSLFLISILHTYANLSGLQIGAGRSENAFVGEEAAFWLTLSSQSLSKLSEGTHSYRQHASIELSWAEAQPKMVDLIDEPQQQVRMLLPVSTRGRYLPPRLVVESRFPLGLLRAWSLIELDTFCVVYPHPRDNELPQRADLEMEDGQNSNRPGSDDFEGLKNYQPGDNPRHIAWKSSARSGTLYSRLFVTQEHANTWLDWEQFAGVGIEERLSRLCFWVLRFADEGRPYGLNLPNEIIEPDQGGAHLQRCLVALSLYGISDAEQSRFF